MAIISELIATFSRRAHLRLHRHRDELARRSRSSASSCGVTTCSSAGMSEFATMIFSALTFLVAIPSGVKVFNWIATLYKGSILARVADALRAVVPLPLHDRRPDGPVPRHAQRRRAPARHVLRRRALPLRHDGRHGHGVRRRPPLLVAEDDRQDVRRADGEDRVRLRLHRLQPHVLSAVHHGLARHAAPLLRLPAAVRAVPPARRPSARGSSRSVSS